MTAAPRPMVDAARVTDAERLAHEARKVAALARYIAWLTRPTEAA